jgi:hypothetical protein
MTPQLFFYMNLVQGNHEVVFQINPRESDSNFLCNVFSYLIILLYKYEKILVQDESLMVVYVLPHFC